MSAPSPVRIVVTTIRDGARRYRLACRCASVDGFLGSWEHPVDVIARLARLHRELVPDCPHRMPVTATSQARRPLVGRQEHQP